LNSGSILYFTEDIRFLLRDKRKLRNWIYHCMKAEEKSIGNVNIIFCSDRYLLDLNQTYLHHDTFTDIITFDYSESRNALSGDIFISIERVKNNAQKFHTSFLNELHRVIIHGFLHLAGYKDKSKSEQQIMRSKEDYCLSLQPKFWN